jgi:hypothetical protein
MSVETFKAALQPTHEATMARFTPKQASRLSAFDHLLARIDEYKPRVQAGEKIEWAIHDSQDKVVQRLFTVNPWMIHQMEQTAFHMYEDMSRQEKLGAHGETVVFEDPQMKQAAQEILDQRAAARKAKEIPTEKLQSMWDH